MIKNILFFLLGFILGATYPKEAKFYTNLVLTKASIFLEHLKKRLEENHSTDEIYKPLKKYQDKIYHPSSNLQKKESKEKIDELEKFNKF